GRAIRFATPVKINIIPKQYRGMSDMISTLTEDNNYLKGIASNAETTIRTANGKLGAVTAALNRQGREKLANQELAHTTRVRELRKNHLIVRNSDRAKAKKTAIIVGASGTTAGAGAGYVAGRKKEEHRFASKDDREKI